MKVGRKERGTEEKVDGRVEEMKVELKKESRKLLKKGKWYRRKAEKSSKKGKRNRRAG